MTTIGVARPGIPFSLGIDTVDDLDESTLRAMRDDPVTPIRWIALYLHAANAAAKRDAAFAVGLPIKPVTFSRAVGWKPSENEGELDGNGDVARALELGIAPTVHLDTDLEGCAGTVQTTSLWCNARGRVQVAGGFGPGLYVGAGQALQGVQLGALIQNRYWKALSRLVAPGAPPGYVIEPSEGWSTIQLPHTTVFCGVPVDFNVLCFDWLNRIPILWWPT